MPQTLQCPKCKKAVTVGDESAGQRVKCPHCQQSFLAPGFAATSNDDDDWLSLDTDVATIPTPAQSSEPAPVPADLLSADFDDDDGDEVEIIDDVEIIDNESVLSKLSDQLKEFTAAVEPLPRSGDRETSDPFGDLPAMSPAPIPNAEEMDVDAEFMIPDLPVPPRGPVSQSLPSQSLPAQSDPFDDLDGDYPTAKAPVADAVEYASEYRVKCNICGSILYAKAAQAGKTIKCTDCHSQVKVPPPPKVKQRPKIDVENARTFSFEETPANSKKREDPYRKSAQDLLDEAERAENETDKPYVDPDIPSMRDWAMNVFGIFLDVGVIAHWIGLSLLGGIPAAIVLSVGNPILYIGLIVAGIIFTTLTIACGFAIMQSVANQQESVTDWPEADPTAWFDDLIVAVMAMVFAGVPMLMITSFALGPGLLSTALTMFSIYLLFPFFVLSMMDMQSVFAPFSPEVARSVTRCQESWGGLYFSAGLLFFGLFLFFVALSSAAPAAAAVLMVVATVGVLFSYFSMIGRLAYAIGQSVNEPAKKSTKSKSADVDQTPPK
ncbi:MAG: hypothetical protein WBD20_08710 [Pirellulaceae bacterium]